MEKLQQAVQVEAQKRIAATSARIGVRLADELPAHLRVQFVPGRVVISGRGLGSELLHNPDLRAVGYLMKGVR